MDLRDPSMPPAPEPRHFGYIDALRGLAFLGVFFFHITFSVVGLPRLMGDVLGRGFAGVQLFFVVSAFTLCASFESRGTGPAAIRDFFVRRVCRIAPMFWLAILFYWVMSGLGPFWEIPGGVGLLQYALAVLLAHGFDPRALNGIVPGGWSVAVEIQFYLLLPLLYVFASSLARAVMLLAAAVALSIAGLPLIEHLVAPHYPAASREFVHQFAFYSLPVQLPVFCCGILAHRLLGPDRPVLLAMGHHVPGSPRMRAVAALIVIALFGFPVALRTHPIGLVRTFPGFLGYGLLFAILLGILSLVRIRLLDNPVTRFIGKVSYSAYLLHFFVLVVVHATLGSDAMPPLPSFALQSSVGLAITIGLATVSFEWIEAPGMAFGKRLIKRLGARRAEPAAQFTPAVVGGMVAGPIETQTLGSACDWRLTNP